MLQRTAIYFVAIATAFSIYRNAPSQTAALIMLALFIAGGFFLAKFTR